MDTEKNSALSYLMFIGAMLIVGTIGVIRRYIPLSSALLAFFRGLIGALSLLLYVLLRRRRGMEKIERKKLALLLLNGVFLAVNWLCLFESFRYTTISRATLCYYMQPTILLLLSPLVFREKLTGKKLLCAAAALLGMVLVSGVLESGSGGGSDLRGVLFALGGACFYATLAILNKKVEGVDAYDKTIIQLFAASAVMGVYLLATRGVAGLAFTPRLALLLLLVGVIYTGVVYALYFGSMSGLKAQTISALGYIDPVVAMVASALILGEGMSAAGIVGAVLIIGSTLVSELTDGSAPKGKR